VLHIATVHYGSPLWIEIQTRALREHISVPFLTWSSLELIDQSYAQHFDRVIDQAGRHSDKLNHLAIEISREASDDDLLVFIDGDAFPIADPMPLIEAGLARAPLIAIRRDENDGERQPHPSFCVTTVGTWRTLPGDWSVGYRWIDGRGRRITDVGGNLLRALELSDTPWVPLLRSNRRNLDPILFGIYGDVIYHHGGGFRPGILTSGHYVSAPRRFRPPHIPILRQLVRRINRLRRRAWKRRTARQQLRDSQSVFADIQRGGSGWLSEFL
jgi:hypothetical protein